MGLQPVGLMESGVLMKMPFNPVFCSDEESTRVHGGILTSLLDSAFGFANMVATDQIETMATLDLRVDYLRPATARTDLNVFAECYRATRHVAFMSGRAWFDGGEDVARGTASFAIVRGPRGNLMRVLPPAASTEAAIE